MFMRSERLFLRPGWPEDWEEILARIADEAVVMNLARAPWPYTERDAQEFLQRPQERLLPQLLVTLPDGQGPGSQGASVIGSVGLTVPAADPEGRTETPDVELGYWIARSHWGQGYATEAVRAMLCLARSLGHRRVVAHHFADNAASGRVLAKAGFRQLGPARERPSRARGGSSPALSYMVELEVAGRGDDGDMKRAA